MRIFSNPTVGTVLCGLLCATLFVPLQWAMDLFFPPGASRAAAFSFFAGIYPVLLAARGERRTAAAVGLFIAGVAAVVLLSPRSPLAWAIGVWIFFLVQSLFFALAKTGGSEKMPGEDPFEEAARRAEEILGVDGDPEEASTPAFP